MNINRKKTEKTKYVSLSEESRHDDLTCPGRVNEKSVETATCPEGAEQVSLLSEIVSYIAVVLIVFVVMMAVFRVLQPMSVSGESMTPNFLNNDRVLVYKMAYRNKMPERGDVIVANANIDGEKTRIVKRVIGLPGEKLSFKNGYVYVNGARLDESYISGNITSEGELGKGPIKVEKDEVFCMGDNREDSEDSRDFGAIRKKYIIGKVVFRVFHFSNFGVIRSVDYSRRRL